MPRLIILFVAVTIIGLPIGLTEWCRSDSDPGHLVGEVRDEHGPVAGAVIRIKGTSLSAISDDDGRFRLPRTDGPVRITVSKDGYFIGGYSSLDLPIVFRLRRLPSEDCQCYAWVDPTPNPKERMNCGNCHKSIHQEWSPSRHATSATNRRLRNLYEGTDWHGRRDVSWNLLKEHPDGADVCSSCHAPTQKSGPFGRFDLRAAANDGLGLSGVHCDFCHKIRGPGDGVVGLTHGRYQLSPLRPASAEHQLFFGPLDDVDRGEDSFSGFQRDSRFCAACHEGVVFGVPVYSTFSEWRASPAGESGRTCQSCHMTPTGKMWNIAPGNGGIRRDPSTLGNHTFFSGSQLEMLRRCLDLQSAVQRDDREVTVEVKLMASGVGHRVPTGYIDRQLILFVDAFAGELSVRLRSGPTLDEFLSNDEAGRAGRLFARSLEDGMGVRPAPFWRADPATLIDTRLHPGVTEELRFAFPIDTDRIRIRLVHRRFWKSVADAKNWPSNDLLIAERDIRVK